MVGFDYYGYFRLFGKLLVAIWSQKKESMDLPTTPLKLNFDYALYYTFFCLNLLNNIPAPPRPKRSIVAGSGTALVSDSSAKTMRPNAIPLAPESADKVNEL